MTKRNGAGPKPVARKRARGASGRDEQPQGFQPERMRVLWDNIDHARAKLEPESSAAPAHTPSFLGALVPATLLDLTPCALLSRASGWIVRLPGVEWLLGFWRSSPSS